MITEPFDALLKSELLGHGSKFRNNEHAKKLKKHKEIIKRRKRNKIARNIRKQNQKKR